MAFKLVMWNSLFNEDVICAEVCLLQGLMDLFERDVMVELPKVVNFRISVRVVFGRSTMPSLLDRAPEATCNFQT